MCFSSSTDTSSSGSNFNYSQNPAWLNRDANQLGGQITSAASQGYTPYTGPTTGTFGSTFGTAENDATARSAATDPNFAAGTSSLAQGLGLAGTTASTPVSSLMSSYTDAALQPTLQAIQRQAATNNTGLATNATMAGAFGDTGYGTQKALNNYDTQQSISDATETAYNQAYNTALSTQQNALSQLFGGVGQASSLGSSSNSAQTSLEALLGSLGSTVQSANQTGINTAVNVNDLNNTGNARILSSLSGALGSIPHNTWSNGTSTQDSTTTRPDNTIFGALGSLGAGALSGGGLSSLLNFGSSAGANAAQDAAQDAAYLV